MTVAAFFIVVYLYSKNTDNFTSLHTQLAGFLEHIQPLLEHDNTPVIEATVQRKLEGLVTDILVGEYLLSQAEALGSMSVANVIGNQVSVQRKLLTAALENQILFGFSLSRKSLFDRMEAAFAVRKAKALNQP